jgi:hypothetical protein
MVKNEIETEKQRKIASVDINKFKGIFKYFFMSLKYNEIIINKK